MFFFFHDRVSISALNSVLLYAREKKWLGLQFNNIFGFEIFESRKKIKNTFLKKRHRLHKTNV